MAHVGTIEIFTSCSSGGIESSHGLIVACLMVTRVKVYPSYPYRLMTQHKPESLGGSKAGQLPNRAPLEDTEYRPEKVFLLTQAIGQCET